MATFPKALCELRALWSEGGLGRLWRLGDQDDPPQSPLASSEAAGKASENQAVAVADPNRNRGGPSSSS